MVLRICNISTIYRTEASPKFLIFVVYELRDGQVGYLLGPGGDSVMIKNDLMSRMCHVVRLSGIDSDMTFQSGPERTCL